MLMRIFKSFFLIINYKTVITSAISLAAAYLCNEFNIKAEFPLYLISIAIVFPIVFSIDSAYKRREFALQQYADLKAHALSYYYGVREWVQPNKPHIAEEVKIEINELFETMSSNFLLDPEEAKKKEHEMYIRFSHLSARVAEFKEYGSAGSENSRLHQYVSKMLVSYGIMKNVFYYRTPITLRAYSKIFIYFFPILYGPFSASTLSDYSHGIGYLIAVLYSVILVSLDNLQEHLENPFDQVGEDDIKFEVGELNDAMIK